MYPIDKNVPLPKNFKPLGVTKYPLRKMKIGDSFFMPDEKGLEEKAARQRVYSAAGNIRKTPKFKMFRVDIRRMKKGRKDGLRVWRTA